MYSMCLDSMYRSVCTNKLFSTNENFRFYSYHSLWFEIMFLYQFIFSERFESSDATKIFRIWSLVLIFVFLWCTEIESGLLLIFVVLTIVKIPIVVFQFDRVHFSWNFIVRLVVTVSRLCRGHLCWSMLLAMFWSHYDPILWSKYSILALFDCSWTFPSDDNPYFDSFSNSLFVCRQL